MKHASPPVSHRSPWAPTPRRALAWVAVAAALAAVFVSYLNPSMVFDLATRVWACF